MTRLRWRSVLGFEGIYEISSSGVVCSFKVNIPRYLKPSTTKKGYSRVDLYQGGRRTPVLIHTLVLEAFRGLCPEGLECRHLNGEPQDNRLVNLNWGTSEENRADSKRHGTFLRGEDHPSAKLTENQARVILLSDQSPRNLAAFYGVHPVLIRRIWAGVAWPHLGGRERRKSNFYVRGSDHPSAKLTWAKVDEIRTSGLSSAALASEFGVSRESINNVLSGRTWKE